MKKHIFILVLALVSLASCRTVQPIVVTKTIHDTISNTQIQHDSVYVSVDRWRSNDTVYLKEFEYKYKFIHDSVYVNHTDSIPYEVPYEVTVYKHGFVWYCGIMFIVIMSILLLVFLAFLVIKIIK